MKFDYEAYKPFKEYQEGNLWVYECADDDLYLVRVYVDDNGEIVKMQDVPGECACRSCQESS